MAETVTVPGDTTTLEELLARVASGEEVVITQGGAAVARMLPVQDAPRPPKPVRRPGLYAGVADIGPEFFEPLPEEELRAWEGADETRASDRRAARHPRLRLVCRRA